MVSILCRYKNIVAQSMAVWSDSILNKNTVVIWQCTVNSKYDGR